MKFYFEQQLCKTLQLLDQQCFSDYEPSTLVLTFYFLSWKDKLQLLLMVTGFVFCHSYPNSARHLRTKLCKYFKIFDTVKIRTFSLVLERTHSVKKAKV